MKAFCSKDLIKWKCPREIEFRDELPLTLVGKVAFKELKKQEIERLRRAGNFSLDRVSGMHVGDNGL